MVKTIRVSDDTWGKINAIKFAQRAKSLEDVLLSFLGETKPSEPLAPSIEKPIKAEPSARAVKAWKDMTPEEREDDGERRKAEAEARLKAKLAEINHAEPAEVMQVGEGKPVKLPDKETSTWSDTPSPESVFKKLKEVGQS